METLSTLEPVPQPSHTVVTARKTDAFFCREITRLAQPSGAFRELAFSGKMVPKPRKFT